MELISVVVPVYNLERYLGPSVESILAQTYQNIEIILVNDGSTDSSGEICDRFAASDPRVRVIHKRNGGVSSARNVGLDAAQGSLIGFVDGDDRIHPDMYLELYRAITSFDADVARCGYNSIPGSDAEKIEGSLSKVGKQKYRELNREEGLQEQLRSRMIEPSVWNKLYRAELFSGVRFTEEIVIGEDYLVNYELFKKAKSCVWFDTPLYAYIRRGDSCTMAKFNEKELHAIEVARRAIEDVKESEPEMIPYGQARLVRVIVATYNRVVFHGEYRGIKDRLRAELCALRPEIMHNPCISKTQKLAVWGITAFPALYNIPLFVRWCYRKRNRNV